MSIVKINAITVPRDRFAEFERRFAARAGRVSSAEGFEAFELLRPNDDREVCLVLTRWRSEEDFQAWVTGADFKAGHAQHRRTAPSGRAARSGPSTCSSLRGPRESRPAPGLSSPRWRRRPSRACGWSRRSELTLDRVGRARQPPLLPRRRARLDGQRQARRRAEHGRRRATATTSAR